MKKAKQKRLADRHAAGTLVLRVWFRPAVSPKAGDTACVVVHSVAGRGVPRRTATRSA